ncbi:MAG: glycosyltransferase family 4 protein [Polyangiaceae bacterium]|nr:glycosyltransferase family 4 protein [Polyangiaceae bacterium]
MSLTAAIRTVAMIGNHLPRQCGIATFTADLSEAVASERPALDCFVVAMNDPGRHHAYPPRVRFEIAEGDLASYRRAGDFLNVNGVDVVSLQHEYGIFGGKAGSHVLALLNELRMPIVTTLHTLLPKPDPAQRAAMDEVTRLSERLVVMSAHGASLLRGVHGVPDNKIDIIHHGIATIPDAHRAKHRLGLDGKFTLLTFGLVSPDKGIELVIDALPAIRERCPNVVYAVLGATHPHVKERHGETYRHSLEKRAIKLGVDDCIIFHNRFVSREELAEFLAAADVYITPYLKPDQICSGTLAYALGVGKAVISTPYWYARELLDGERGILVPWNDPSAIASEVISLAQDDARRLAIQAKAAAFGRDMSWPVVARKYMGSFERARASYGAGKRSTFRAQTLAERPVTLPEVRLEHMSLLTDDTGILQHAMFGVPRYGDGYCTDDNARALMVATMIEDEGTADLATVRALSSRYLAFLAYAFSPVAGRFRNFMSYTRRWLEEEGSEDCHGRALWALGTVVGRSTDPGRNSLAGHLFHAALPVTESFKSPRAWAFTLLGLDEYLRAFRGDSAVEELRRVLSERLLQLFSEVSQAGWPWIEEKLTYENPRISQAMIRSGVRMGSEDLVAAGLRSLRWLGHVQVSEEGYFAPIGSNGFYTRGGPKAAFDQQPVEACAMVSACLDAQQITRDDSWGRDARRAFEWFLGHNQIRLSLCDPATGACRDGLHPDRLNENQGAEATVSFLLALLELRAAERARVVRLPERVEAA